MLSEDDLKKLEDLDHLHPFNFKEFEEKYLLSNDWGEFAFLSQEEFKDFLEDDLKEDSEAYKELFEKGFYKRNLSEYEEIKEKYRKRKTQVTCGPSLHIIVVTKRCNQNCIYCQVSAECRKREEFDMDKETAREVVDTAFETNSEGLTIEFQGGEPLLNWEVVKFIVEYGRKKEKETGKNLKFALVTNLSLMTEEKLDFLNEKMVSICTSLDGPEEIHNKNRPYPEGNAYRETIKWIEKQQERRKEQKEKGEDLPSINALVTSTRLNLEKPVKLINEYIENDMNAIHLRPVSYLGESGGDFKEKMGYSAEEFVDFWKKGLDYIVDINDSGTFFRERGAKIKLRNLFTEGGSNYTDLSSPCGAVIGQVTYNYDGEAYTCDEGRMLDEDLFKIGDAKEDSYEDLVNNDTTQSMITASLLDNQSCDTCVYKPFCGVCPVKNFAHHGTLFPPMRTTDWCKIHMAQFDYLLSKLKEEKYREVFESWLNHPGSKKRNITYLKSKNNSDE